MKSGLIWNRTKKNSSRNPLRIEISIKNKSDGDNKSSRNNNYKTNFIYPQKF